MITNGTPCCSVIDWGSISYESNKKRFKRSKVDEWKSLQGNNFVYLQVLAPYAKQFILFLWTDFSRMPTKLLKRWFLESIGHCLTVCESVLGKPHWCNRKRRWRSSFLLAIVYSTRLRIQNPEAWLLGRFFALRTTIIYTRPRILVGYFTVVVQYCSPFYCALRRPRDQACRRLKKK